MSGPRLWLRMTITGKAVRSWPHYSATTSCHPELEVAFVPFSVTHWPITPAVAQELPSMIFQLCPTPSLSLCISYTLGCGYVTQFVDESPESGGENCSLLLASRWRLQISLNILPTLPSLLIPEQAATVPSLSFKISFLELGASINFSL